MMMLSCLLLQFRLPSIALQDGLATLVTWAIALTWLACANQMATQGWIQPTLSRKLIHIGTGPLFVLCWPLYSAAAYSRYLAVTVPLVLTLIFLAVGMGWLHYPPLVQSSTRTGDRTELLRGPLYYGVVFVVCTVVFWRQSPVGMLALMVMCGGDGLADVVGRRWGRHKLPFSADKSWVGSAAMLGGSLFFGLGFLLGFNHLGYFQPSLGWDQTVVVVGAIALVATLVEALPFKDIDNLTLTLVVIGLSYGLHLQSGFGF